MAERINQTITTVLKCFKYEDIDTVEYKINFRLTNSHHRTMNCSPNELVRGFSELDPLQRSIVIDTAETFQRIETQQKSDNLRLNNKRLKYNYATGDLVLLRNYLNKGKLEPNFLGPYEVVEVSTNTIKIRKEGKVEEVNIKRVNPLKGW
ncbi:hypothetical protein A0H76_439 [Hepatospora eriocheir]|uniref:POL4 n=1 Tax=Hepatospora eriocheir TaxID=1081669 RepID=A0A1X0QL64_9MICR|nr:hypothetical protein A0H76_439 [Hepatospora eriocheir]